MTLQSTKTGDDERPDAHHQSGDGSHLLTQFMNRTLEHNANSAITADFATCFFKENENSLIDINVLQLESGLAELRSNFIQNESSRVSHSADVKQERDVSLDKFN